MKIFTSNITIEKECLNFMHRTSKDIQSEIDGNSIPLINEDSDLRSNIVKVLLWFLDPDRQNYITDHQKICFIYLLWKLYNFKRQDITTQHITYIIQILKVHNIIVANNQETCKLLNTNEILLNQLNNDLLTFFSLVKNYSDITDINKKLNLYHCDFHNILWDETLDHQSDNESLKNKISNEDRMKNKYSNILSDNNYEINGTNNNIIFSILIFIGLTFGLAMIFYKNFYTNKNTTESIEDNEDN